MSWPEPPNSVSVPEPPTTVGLPGEPPRYSRLPDPPCARVAAERGLPLGFVVVGETCDDASLLDTGVVRITGRYGEAEAVGLIAAQNADVGWLPSVWPETWSYVLTKLWDAGLFTFVHDIGAPAARVRTSGGGLVLPLHPPAEWLAECFLKARSLQSGVEPCGPGASSGLLEALPLAV